MNREYLLSLIRDHWLGTITKGAAGAGGAKLMAVASSLNDSMDATAARWLGLLVIVLTVVNLTFDIRRKYRDRNK